MSHHAPHRALWVGSCASCSASLEFGPYGAQHDAEGAVLRLACPRCGDGVALYRHDEHLVAGYPFTPVDGPPATRPRRRRRRR